MGINFLLAIDIIPRYIEIEDSGRHWTRFVIQDFHQKILWATLVDPKRTVSNTLNETFLEFYAQKEEEEKNGLKSKKKKFIGLTNTEKINKMQSARMDGEKEERREKKKKNTYKYE